MDLIRKAMYLGLGAVSLTKEKAEEVIDDLVKRGEAKESDRTKMLDSLLREGEMQTKELEGKIASSVQNAVTAIGLPTQKDFKNLLKRLERIEQAIGTTGGEKEGPKA